jgi:hypothetical protein
MPYTRHAMTHPPAPQPPLPSYVQAPPSRRGGLALALIVGLASFYGSLLLAAVVGPLFRGHGSTLSAYSCVTWAGAAVLTALLVGLVSPDYSLSVGAPLIVVSELFVLAAGAVVGGAGGYHLPGSMISGALCGALLGPLAATVMTVAAPTRRGLTALGGVLLFVLALLAAGARDSHVVRQALGAGGGHSGPVPAVERLLREDVLAQPGPLEWDTPGVLTETDGNTWITATGRMSRPSLGVHLRVRLGPQANAVPRARQELNLLFPWHGRADRQAQLPEAWAALSTWGLRPEFLAGFRQEGEVLACTYGGRRYVLDPHQMAGDSLSGWGAALTVTEAERPAL